MKIKNEPEVIAFGANSIITNIHNLQDCMHSAKTRKNSDDIHDLRVASRRIRASLEVFATLLPQKKIALWENSIRKLTKAFGSARDLDVQIEFITSLYRQSIEKNLKPGIRRILLRLTQKRQGIQQDLEETLRDYQQKEILNKMLASLDPLVLVEPDQQQFSPDLYQLAFEILHKRLEEFLYHEIYIPYPERIKELHLMRIAAKRLRYSLEVFAPIYANKMEHVLDVLRCVQTSLGDIRDCDVWLIYIPKFIEKEKKRVKSYYGNPRPFTRLIPGAQSVQQDRLAKRNILYQEFLKNWKVWHQEDIWGKLTQEIVKPVLAKSGSESSSTISSNEINNNTETVQSDSQPT